MNEEMKKLKEKILGKLFYTRHTEQLAHELVDDMIALVRQATIEECAKVARNWLTCDEVTGRDGMKELAAAIEALSPGKEGR